MFFHKYSLCDGHSGVRQSEGYNPRPSGWKSQENKSLLFIINLGKPISRVTPLCSDMTGVLATVLYYYELTRWVTQTGAVVWCPVCGETQEGVCNTGAKQVIRMMMMMMIIVMMMKMMRMMMMMVVMMIK